MEGFRTFMLPKEVLQKKMQGNKTVLATSAHGEKVYDLAYYIKGALAGGICCGITHGALW